MLCAGHYRDQAQADAHPAEANSRYNLQTSDFRSLYRRHYREAFGIDISVAPEQNVHNWLDPESRFFKRDIRDAVFHYSARTTEAERLKVCIATPEMQRAAWKYCHGGQLVLDGTFGLCDSRVLLWIAMGVDENNNGVPVAMFLFSAPTGNKATHAGYDTAILTELLTTWRDSLTRTGPPPSCSSITPGTVFAPDVGMTDTDTKERGALLKVWPLILLLLCRFHIRQCWTNRRSSLIKTLAGSTWHEYTNKHLHTLEEA